MYGTIEAFRTYAADRGNSGPTDGANNVVTQALLRASDYIRMRYVTQHSLDVADPATLAIVEEATYIAAQQELLKPGFWSATYTPAQTKVLTEVKGIKWTLLPGAANANGMVPTSSAIEGLFYGLTRSNIPTAWFV